MHRFSLKKVLPMSFGTPPTRSVVLAVMVVSIWAPAMAVEIDWTRARSLTHGGAYVDLGYLLSSNQPGNHTWRSKGTTTVLDRMRLNNTAIAIQKLSADDAPWGFAVGLQAGKDVDNQVTSNAISSAETLKHLYYTYLSYLFDVGDGLVIGSGLIPGHIGYESFHALDNPTYTRVYGVDNVPYFNWGVGAVYAPDKPLSGGLLLLNGWNYLERPNDAPSYGLQLKWQAAEDGHFTQNFYYGPDQTDTASEFWRFVTNTIVEWQVEDFLLAGSFGYGTEKQADIIDNPRYDWLWAAVWVKWTFQEGWHLTLRPEVFNDEDGLMSGFAQTIRAVTMGLEYRLAPDERNELSFRMEYRFDRSTGRDGGFFEGDANVLVPEQHLFIGALIWQFDSGVRGL